MILALKVCHQSSWFCLKAILILIVQYIPTYFIISNTPKLGFIFRLQWWEWQWEDVLGHAHAASAVWPGRGWIRDRRLQAPVCDNDRPQVSVFSSHGHQHRVKSSGKTKLTKSIRVVVQQLTKSSRVVRQQLFQVKLIDKETIVICQVVSQWLL